MLVAGQDQVDAAQSPPRIGARVMRTCGRSVAAYFLVKCSER